MRTPAGSRAALTQTGPLEQFTVSEFHFPVRDWDLCRYSDWALLSCAVLPWIVEQRTWNRSRASTCAISQGIGGGRPGVGSHCPGEVGRGGGACQGASDPEGVMGAPGGGRSGRWGTGARTASMSRSNMRPSRSRPSADEVAVSMPTRMMTTSSA